MGDFICFERHLEVLGISICFDLQKVPRRINSEASDVWLKELNCFLFS